MTATMNANNETTMAKGSSMDRSGRSHSLSPYDPRLEHGGLTGLQNLGNTVSIYFFHCILLIFHFIVFYEFSASMFIEYKTTFIILL